MRKILLVTHWDWVMVHFRLPLAKALRDEGCEVVCVCPGGRYISKIQEQGFRWVRWTVNRRSLNPLLELRSLFHLIWIYRVEKPYLVHHFTIKPMLYGSIAGWVTRIPYIVNTPTGVTFIFSESPKARLLRIFVKPLFRWVMGRTRLYVIFFNEEDQEVFLKQGILCPSQCVIIPGSGVNTTLFHPKGRQGSEEEPPKVLMAGRLLWDKGVREYVEAAKMLKARGIKARFLLAGEPDPGNPECIPFDYLSYWHQEGIIEFLGHCEDMPQLLQSVDIAVLPSYREGLSKFLLEAGATGLPVVATDIGGCRKIIQNEVNGLLVPVKDVSALAEALRRLLEDPALRQRLGDNNLRIVRDKFSEEVILIRYKDFYRSLGVFD